MSVIETERLTKSYGSSRGIEDVTIAVEAGEVFGFLGPNWAGKTTTIRTLLDLLHPTSGSARLFGLDSHRDSVAIRVRLGNLPGDFGYGKTSTGREALALLARLRGIDGSGRAEALAKRFRADLDRPLGRLSRGNRQKVGLILATFHSPELLILDEPTSGLDPLMQEEFLELIAEERKRGCAIFLSSHELDEVERVCDRVGIVRGGRLIAVERIDDLLGKAKRRVIVLPRTTVREGTTYLCEEAISTTVPFDKGDFAPCLIARAELRGYLPAVRRLKREIRAVKATANPEEMARKRQLEKRLKDFQAQHDSIQRTAQSC